MLESLVDEEDIVQSAFVRAYECIKQFDPARPFGPWFLRSVVNDAIKAPNCRKRWVPGIPSPTLRPTR